MNILLYTHITYYHLIKNISVPNVNIFIIDKDDLNKNSISEIVQKHHIDIIIPIHYQVTVFD